jgi:hypothetical protein
VSSAIPRTGVLDSSWALACRVTNRGDFNA